MGIPQPNNENPNKKSEVRKIAEHKIKQQAQKKGKKLAKKALKKGAKLALKAAVKFGAMLIKLLVALVSAIGLPTILIAAGVVVLVIIISLVVSFMFGSGEGLEGDDQELYNYIVEQADSTVNMSDPVQVRYRVPEELIASVIQLEAMTKEDEKKVIENMADSLAPEFTYNDYNEWKETKTQVCTDGECKPWSDIEREDNWVSKLKDVNFWNGYTVFNYTPYTTEWETNVTIQTKEKEYVEYEKVSRKVTREIPYTEYEYVPYTEKKTITKKYVIPVPPYFVFVDTEIEVEKCCKKREVTKYRTETDIIVDTVPVEKTKEIEIKTITKTRYQRFNTDSNTTEDYSTFDQILNSYELGMNDKRLIEANYMFSNGEIGYTDWLKGNGGFGYVGGGFNGTIIPGAGIPAQFMPYYRAAEKKYGVDWFTLAAVHFVETGFSTHPTMVSSVGAIGHLQFMPATWAGWKYNIGGGLVSSSTDITNLDVIRRGGGYGVDGDGDGKADPWNVVDSIFTAANYLAKSGYATDQRKAIYNYNRASWYVDKVMANAQKYRTQAVYQPAEGDIPPITNGAFMRPTTGNITSGYGPRWGSFHQGVDIGSGGRSNVPIVAAADGVVVKSYRSGSYGEAVIIRHVIDGKQFETLYAHMKNRAVRTGQQVTKGQFLGYMGETGNVTGVHLHFELHSPAWNFSKSGSLNPIDYVPF
ncbi:peptidoglycan DD-metalloendopeptidase family protein [Aquibacillus sp. 3ASR75-11]|uniref:Peptidoglycan DD-metalloendopeptidase family protein n=1 Tax=Terrihalobacillus insolitus TaxID=2950438 RepID=A0A9X4AN90_9BACI|nr:peptidoglycan DD-metalloendopeptidase family protein [Terrihalobacillus insolitus]MDC3424268.1 peptidoglycan DD-metalloendopeptidase family protein [Terrihalobacillus insolitus]